MLIKFRGKRYVIGILLLDLEFVQYVLKYGSSGDAVFIDYCCQMIGALLILQEGAFQELFLLERHWQLLLQ